MSNFVDLTGKKFGKLLVVKRGEDLIKKSGKHEIRWLCQCDCGNPNLSLVLGYNLKNGNTKSCGCLHLLNGYNQGKKQGKINGHLNKKYNQYDLTGEYGIGYTLKNEKFYFDLEDYDKIKEYCWYIDSNGYVVNKTNEKMIFMHRLVTNCSDDMVVDHIYYINNEPTRYDNRKSNLRVLTLQLNRLNHTIASNNTSGYTGVYYHKNTNKWIAEIRINKNKIYLGSFIDINDATKAREEAEKVYFKEFKINNIIV